MTPSDSDQLDLLGPLDPFDLFDQEAARLDGFFSTLDEPGWLAPSQCAGWTVRDVLAHLAGQEAYNHACLDGTVDELFARLRREGVPGGMHGFNEWCVRQRRDVPVADVLAEWRETNGSTRRRMRERGRDGTVATTVGPYPVGLQTFHYASEFATHADDVGVPVTRDEEPARSAWRARVGQFVLAEQGRPAAVNRVATGATEGFEVRVDVATAQLTPAEFVAATVARLPDGHPLDPRLRTALACLA